MNFYKTLETALISSDIDTKANAVTTLLEYCSKNELSCRKDFLPLAWNEPCYSDICQIVSPRDLPARKDFHTDKGLATLVHAITHIEFSAIDLALDAVYRFPDMPQDYVMDWLIVADDEVRHFKMLLGILHKLNFKYGDLPVHQGLFDASVHTREDVLDRMAVIPRHYEAGGLDVNPQIVKKIENRAKNPIVTELIQALHIIHDEEIDHVRKGDRWFRWVCDERNLIPEKTFIEILDKYRLRAKHKPHMNVSARREAGFACEELISLGAKECK